MAITREQALTANEFHIRYHPKDKCQKWRRNGQTQTWVTRPNNFRIPVKHGLYEHAQINHLNNESIYIASECLHCHPIFPGQEDDSPKHNLTVVK